MGEILPDGSTQGYSTYCKKCKATIKTNMQGDYEEDHICKKNVLSLFNGMGCIWLAMQMQGIKINKAYSSEIEKYPNQANDAMFPNTTQIGDVRNVDVSKLDFIDFLGGGSPCQSFSFAGKRKGMSAKEKTTFITPTEEEYYIYLKDSEFEPDYEDYVEECRVKYEIESSGKEFIEILTLEHYLELKEEGFEFEGQSYLFWEYIRILTDIRKYNPDVKFLLENVIMGKKWKKIITQAIGINPIRINAVLVSAQNRDRLFWTNIYTEQDGFFGDLKCIIPQPKDEGIMLKDILETFETSNFETQEKFDDYMKKYFLSDNMLKFLNKHSDKSKEKGNGFNFKIKEEEEKGNCLTARMHKMGVDDNYVAFSNSGKSREYIEVSNIPPLRSHNGCGHDNIIVHNTMPRSSKSGKGGTGPLSREDGKTYYLDTGNTNAIEYKCARMVGRNPENPKSRKSAENMEQQIELRKDYKSGTLTTIQKDNLVMQINPSLESGGVQPYQQNRVYDCDGIMPALNAQLGGRNNVLTPTKTIRRLTPRECGRLQSVPEFQLNILLSSGISDTQLYKMFGNGWNIKVISHILSYLKPL